MSDKDKKKGKETKVEAKPAPKPESKPTKKVKAKKEPKPAVQLPTFLEFTYTFAGFMVFLVPLCVAGVAYTAGADLTQVFLRTLVALLVTGSVALLFTSLVAKGAFEAARAEAKEAEEAKQKASEEEELSMMASLTDVQA